MNNKITIRLAKLKDAQLLLKIHNHSVKNGFFNSKKLVIFKDHIIWLKNKIKFSSSKIYIGQNNKNFFFGNVRFDEVKNNTFEVSIGNLPNFIGKGFGFLILEKSLKKFIKTCSPKKIICVVKKNNVRSSRCFLKNEFLKKKFNPKKHFTINKFNSKKEDYFEHHKDSIKIKKTSINKKPPKLSF
tara:strand:- start:105 stop:659 length:555 start_codon:yes stop_codon:yes gene_type:complete